MKKLFALSCLTLLLFGCTTPTPPADPVEPVAEEVPEPAPVQKLVVATSFYPMTHFAQQVGGDLIELRQVASQGVDPHSYEPTPSQMKDIFEADVFIYNGLGQDPYADRIHEELLQKDTKILIATELVERMAYEHEDDHDEGHDEHEDEHDDHDEHEEEEHHDDDHDEHEPFDSAQDDTHDDHDDHAHGEWDPHVWLDPQRAEGIVQAIAKELSALDPANAAQFQANAAAYSAKLRALDADMAAGLSNCALDGVIVSHDAYRYLANRYGFHTFEIAGLSPSAEPSPARMAELTEIAEKEGIAHVFFETQVSPALSETLAQEIGAETLVLHSIEARTQAERSAGMTYIDLQRMNLQNLRTALQCNE